MPQLPDGGAQRAQVGRVDYPGVEGGGLGGSLWPADAEASPSLRGRVW